LAIYTKIHIYNYSRISKCPCKLANLSNIVWQRLFGG